MQEDRPLLGDIYCPPRHGLDEDNEFLSRVGLLILITGSPAPDVPEIIASKLATIYGGHPDRYKISQAAITPYIITCQSTRLRDAIVQGGTYYIPQRGIRFTIHEWRPRFGLGYDPPSHQVWVRIVGLPLQAWSEKEIAAFLQKFGQPTQILPYGHEAGHFRHITALVDTAHPSLIPLAYKYREENYSTLVDVIILSARSWTLGYFPPPDDQPHQQLPLNQPNHNGGQQSPSHSTASSSHAGASEPTIDLSAWSPRSRNISPPDKTVASPLQTPVHSHVTHLIEKQMSRLPARKLHHHPATVDPFDLDDLSRAQAGISEPHFSPAVASMLSNFSRWLWTLLSDNKILSISMSLCTTLHSSCSLKWILNKGDLIDGISASTLLKQSDAYPYSQQNIKCNQWIFSNSWANSFKPNAPHCKKGHIVINSTHPLQAFTARPFDEDEDLSNPMPEISQNSRIKPRVTQTMLPKLTPPSSDLTCRSHSHLPIAPKNSVAGPLRPNSCNAMIPKAHNLTPPLALIISSPFQTLISWAENKTDLPLYGNLLIDRSPLMNIKCSDSLTLKEFLSHPVNLAPSLMGPTDPRHNNSPPPLTVSQFPVDELNSIHPPHPCCN